MCQARLHISPSPIQLLYQFPGSLTQTFTLQKWLEDTSLLQSRRTMQQYFQEHLQALKEH